MTSEETLERCRIVADGFLETDCAFPDSRVRALHGGGACAAAVCAVGCSPPVVAAAVSLPVACGRQSTRRHLVTGSNRAIGGILVTGSAFVIGGSAIASASCVADALSAACCP